MLPQILILTLAALKSRVLFKSNRDIFTSNYRVKDYFKEEVGSVRYN